MGLFEQILQARRGALNARFAEAGHFSPGTLEPQEFLAHLQEALRPAVEAVGRVNPEAAETVLLALYELSLELFSLEILGPRSPYPAVAQGWRELFPALAPFLALDARRTAASLSNALLRLARHAAARPAEWSGLVEAAATSCPDVPTLLRCGQVAAWRSGMAEFRSGVLELLPGLPPAAALAALGLNPADFPGRVDLAGLAAELDADPWLEPGAFLRGEPPQRSPRQAARCGGFRGFGGPFLAPPRVLAHAQGAFVVRDGAADWLLYADRFGQSF